MFSGSWNSVSAHGKDVVPPHCDTIQFFASINSLLPLSNPHPTVTKGQLKELVTFQFTSNNLPRMARKNSDSRQDILGPQILKGNQT